MTRRILNEMERMPKTLILGHRGSSGEAPENTLAAIKAAKEAGADGVEFDVKLTKDREVVLLHDPKVDRTSNGKGFVKDIFFNDLRKLDFGEWKGNAFKGERAPLLADVFEEFGDDFLLNIEITNYLTPKDGLVEEITKVVRRSGKEMNLLFSSFSSKNLAMVKQYIPNALVGQLVLPGLAGWRQRMACAENYLYSVHPNLSNIGNGFVSKAIKEGKRIFVWTVNDQENIKNAIRLGANAIITDYPGQVIGWLDGNNK